MLLLAGCTITDSEYLLQKSADPFDAERQALLDQPYIDPLTSYLIEHQGDPARASVLREIRQERDSRCQSVAREYADEPAIRAVLERYNLSYGYSCPEHVAEFEKRVIHQRARQKSVPEPEERPPAPEQITPTETVDTSTNEPQIPDQALSDCYLLTSIRNYSTARTACRGPADQGDLRSQVNMARIAFVMEDYNDALKWARKAAPASGEAALLLGYMYARGKGVGQNRNQAVHWFDKSAKLGNKDAQAALDQYR
jgi:hypothetical protein